MGPIEVVKDVEPSTLAQFDAILDVRSPAEFAEDRIANADSLPAFSNVERAEVGTLYKQVSRFEARRVGAAYIARNVAAHLETYFAGKPKDFRPLLYCWRGGMRSNSVATIINAVGWRVSVVEGGYRTWRRHVVANLRDSDTPINVILLDGQTGTAKTDILKRTAATGAQVLDLEGVANHRGSVFGRLGMQPSQKWFETQIWERLRQFDLSKPVLVEAESSLVGRCTIPPRLQKAMNAAARIEVTAPVAARARYLTRAYADIIADEEKMQDAIDRLRPFQPKARIEEWLEWAREGKYEALAEGLMIDHYDPLYLRSRRRRDGRLVKTVSLNDLGAPDLDAAAQEVAGCFS